MARAACAMQSSGCSTSRRQPGGVRAQPRPWAADGVGPPLARLQHLRPGDVHRRQARGLRQLGHVALAQTAYSR